MALVNSHPADPNVQGLQNLSHLPWRVRLPNGRVVDVAPGKNVRLTPGTRVSFGSLEGEIQSTPQPISGRNKALLCGGIGATALCLIIAGAWHYRFQVFETAAPREPSAPEEGRALAHPEKSTPEVLAQSERPRNEKRVTKKGAEEDAASVPAPSEDSPLNPAKIQATHNGIYDLQAFIDFDVLDGAVVDPISGNVSIFGHRGHPDRQLRIPYYDYLATALECKAPTFSLEWKSTSRLEIDRVLHTATQEVLNAVTKFVDNKGRLTFAGAWFLRQYGIPVVIGISQGATLAVMLERANRLKTAEVVVRVTDWLDAKSDPSEAMLALYTTLGLDVAYREIEAKRQAGNVPVSQLMDNFYPRFFNALGTGLEANGHRYADQYGESRHKGRSPSEAFQDAQGHLASDLENLMRRTLDQLIDKDSEIPVPPEVIMNVTGGAVPRMYPVFNDLPPKSQLARIAFQADVAAKSLMCAPELKERIPTYRTEFQFCRAVGRLSETGGGYERCWISPGKFELTQSPDGHTMRFANTPMKFNIRGVSIGASGKRTDVADPVAEQYGAELTAQYDALANELPVFHELRESVKVVALARWLQKRGFPAALPQKGRTEWSPPAELPGIIHVVLSAKGDKVAANSTAEGGVDQRPEGDWILRDAVTAGVTGNQVAIPTKEGLDQQEKDLLEQLDKATTEEEKAGLCVRLSHVRVAKGNASGADDAWKQALKHNAAATYQAERQFQATREAADKAAFFPASGNSLSTRTSKNGVMLPFKQQSKAGFAGPAEADWADNQKFYYQNPIKQINLRQKPNLPPPPIIPNTKENNAIIATHPELQQALDDNVRAWIKREQEYGAGNPARQGELKKENEKKTEEIKQKLNDYHVEMP